MLKHYPRLVALALYITDMFMTLCAFLLAYQLRVSLAPAVGLAGLYPLRGYLGLLAVIAPLWTVLSYRYRTYQSFRTTALRVEMAAIAKVVLLGGLVLIAAVFTLKIENVSRGFLLLFVLLDIILLSAERIGIRLVSRLVRKRGYNYRNVVIVGMGDSARNIARKIRTSGHWGLQILGFVAENGGATEGVFEGHRILGHLRDMEAIVAREVVDEVILSTPGKRFSEYEETLLMLEDCGISVRIVADFFPRVKARMRLENLESTPLLTFTTIPTDRIALAVKRLFDVVVTSIMLIFAAPVLAAAAIAIKLTTPGPVLFKQLRCGLSGRTFLLYKLRSMQADAEQRKSELASLNEMSGPVFKIRNDPRITRVGRFLRKTSIDELPQLWNVLRGDMSLVGPRPPVPEEVARYERWQRRRLSMRPGITCIWQVMGRNRVKDFSDWVRMDLQYIDSWSLGLDLKLFLLTIPAVLSQKGAA